MFKHPSSKFNNNKYNNNKNNNNTRNIFIYEMRSRES